jgi:hypothetical protein
VWRRWTESERGASRYIVIPRRVQRERHAAQPIHDEALAAVGPILLDSVDEIVRRHIEALKTDRSYSRIEMMSDVQIADNTATVDA